MAVQFESKTFTKPGRVAAGETPETYTCNQVVSGSLGDHLETAVASALEVCGNDTAALVSAIEDGVNRHLRSLASGSDEATKLARQVVKLGLSGGKSVGEIASAIRSGAIKF